MNNSSVLNDEQAVAYVKSLSPQALQTLMGAMQHRILSSEALNATQSQHQGLSTPALLAVQSQSGAGLQRTLSSSSAYSNSSAGYHTPTFHTPTLPPYQSLSILNPAVTSTNASSDSASDESSGEDEARKRNRKKSSRKKRLSKKRKRRMDKLADDKKAVNDELMQLLDVSHLAPFKSCMFYRKLKKSSPEGEKILKQYEDINMKAFKMSTRELRRRLAGRDLARLQKKDPSLTSSTLNDRYETAMLALVRKRRANHMQSWRLYGRPKKCIYNKMPTMPSYPQRVGSGRRPLTAEGLSPPQPCGTPPPAASSSIPSESESDDPDFFYSDEEEETQQASDSATDDKTSPSVDSATTEQVDAPDANSPVTDGATDKANTSPSVDSATTEQVDAPDANSPVTVTSLPPPPPVTMHKVKTRCPCGAIITHNSGFPQNKRDQWANKTTLRCSDCWNQHVDNNLLQNIENEDTRAKKSRQFEKEKRRREKADSQKTAKVGSDDVPKKKRAKRTHCKCGSTTHLTARHSLCPLNKKNRTIAKTNTSPAVDTTPDNNTTPADNTVVTPPQSYQFPEPPTHPLKKRPGTKDLVGRTFRDENHYDSNGNIEFEGGEFVVVSVVTGGYVWVVRKDNPVVREKYKWMAVKEMVVDYEKNIKW